MKKILVLLVAVIASATVLANQNADSTYIVTKDTVKANVELVKHTTKSGNESIKALYMGKKYSICKKDIEAFDPNKSYVVFNNYSNGERKISKVIIK